MQSCIDQIGRPFDGRAVGMPAHGGIWLLVRSVHRWAKGNPCPSSLGLSSSLVFKCWLQSSTPPLSTASTLQALHCSSWAAHSSAARTLPQNTHELQVPCCCSPRPPCNLASKSMPCRWGAEEHEETMAAWKREPQLLLLTWQQHRL